MAGVAPQCACPTCAHREKLDMDLIDGEPEYEVEKILDKKARGKGRKMYYLIKWKGYPASDNSWEPMDDVHAPELIADWEKKTNKSKAKK